jgi:hypothetical protein
MIYEEDKEEAMGAAYSQVRTTYFLLEIATNVLIFWVIVFFLPWTLDIKV